MICYPCTIDVQNIKVNRLDTLKANSHTAIEIAKTLRRRNLNRKNGYQSYFCDCDMAM